MDSNYYISRTQLLQPEIFKEEWDGISEVASTLLFKKGLLQNIVILFVTIAWPESLNKINTYKNKQSGFHNYTNSSYLEDQKETYFLFLATLLQPLHHSFLIQQTFQQSLRESHITWATVIFLCRGFPTLYKLQKRTLPYSPQLWLNSNTFNSNKPETGKCFSWVYVVQYYIW